MLNKKITLTIFSIALLFLACKKERSCVCTTISQGVTTTFDTTFTPLSKKDATEACTDFDDGGDDGAGGIYYTTCELK